MDYHGLIEALTETLSSDPRVMAVFLGGSNGRGTADEYSDIDLTVCAAPDDIPALCDDLIGLIDGTAETVHSQRVGDLPVFTFIARPWLRFDVEVTDAATLAARPVESLAVLHDPASLLYHSPATEADPEPAPDPLIVAELTREFLRVLGLLPVVLGRGEFVRGVSGFGLLHAMLAQAIRLGAETTDPGGQLRLRPLADVDVYHRLESLPPISATAEAVTAGHLACARIFLPLARTLHDRSGAAWPTAMAEALEAHLSETVDESFAGRVTQTQNHYIR